ncbi:hypothetical protein CIB48_g9097 [Xylaria polymorpha]|nr:hypothetical protein CIB48_g9097 [Xylaria polymorpha]
MKRPGILRGPNLRHDSEYSNAQVRDSYLDAQTTAAKEDPSSHAARICCCLVWRQDKDTFTAGQQGNALLDPACNESSFGSMGSHLLVLSGFLDTVAGNGLILIAER